MPLFKQFITAIKDRPELYYLIASESLKAAFKHLDESAEQLMKLKGTTKAPQEDNAFEQWGKQILALEQRSKAEDTGESQKPWRFVFDVPMLGNRYIEDPVVQICTGAPEFYRFVMTFERAGVDVRFDETCIDSSPDLSVITSQSANQARRGRPPGHVLNLQERKRQDEELGVQRIAILGPARVFIHENKNESHVALVKNIQVQMNRCLDVLEQTDVERNKGIPKPRYRFVNGGWAGKDEGSTGVPFISALFGSLADKQQQQKESVTIMPKGGAYDRVEGIDPDNYYEVPGTWGDDSKYLIGYSSSLMVFEPYGFWTGIELNNAMAQGKPIAVITQEPLANETDSRRGYQEVQVDLKEGKKGSYRRYTDGAQAALWMNRCWNVSFIKSLEFDSPKTYKQLSDLGSNYIENNQVTHQQWVNDALQLLEENQQSLFKIALVKHNGTNLQFLTGQDKEDMQLVMFAVKQNPIALNYAASVLKNDPFLSSLAKKPDVERVKEVNDYLQKQPVQQRIIRDQQQPAARPPASTREEVQPVQPNRINDQHPKAELKFSTPEEKQPVQPHMVRHESSISDPKPANSHDEKRNKGQSPVELEAPIREEQHVQPNRINVQQPAVELEVSTSEEEQDQLVRHESSTSDLESANLHDEERPAQRDEEQPAEQQEVKRNKMLPLGGEEFIKELKKYQENRGKNPDEYYHGFFSKWFGGFSKTEKINAVENLIASIEQQEAVDPRHIPALNQGQLGKVSG